MALFTQLPIYKSTYELLHQLVSMLKDLPRDNRYTLGQDLQHMTMQLIVLIYRASRSGHKVGIIMRMREVLLQVQVYIRLLCDIKSISRGRYIALAAHTADMSKQLAAWEKSERNKKQPKQSGGPAPTEE